MCIVEWVRAATAPGVRGKVRKEDIREGVVMVPNRR
jgi:hypothetical protein